MEPQKHGTSSAASLTAYQSLLYNKKGLPTVFKKVKAGSQYDAHTSVKEREGTERRASNCAHKTGRSVTLRDAPFPDPRIDSSSNPPFSRV